MGTAEAQFTSVIDVPPATVGGKIGADTQLNLFDGGILPNDFAIGDSGGTSANLEVNVYGGAIGRNLRVLSGAVLNVSGGQIGQGAVAWDSDVQISGGRILANFKVEDSTITMSGGQIDSFFELRGASVLDLTGGLIGPDFAIGPGATANISGGTVNGLGVAPNSVANISGGSIGRANIDGTAKISGGSFAPSFATYSGSQVEIAGGEFRLNGNLIAGLDTLGSSLAIGLAPGNTLSGTLADGTPFAFSSWGNDSIASGSLRLKATALPTIAPQVIYASAGSVPLGIREGQTLVVDSATNMPKNFNAGRGSTVDILPGGQVESTLEAVSAVVTVNGGSTGAVSIYDGTMLQVNDGIVGNVIADGSSIVSMAGGSMNFIDVINGSKLMLTGGSLNGMNAQDGAIIDVSGGTIGSLFRILRGSTVTIAGGSVGDDVRCSGGSVVAISGGVLGDGFTTISGSRVTISGGSFGDAVTNSAGDLTRLVGNDFRLNGAAISGLTPPMPNPRITVGQNDILSGVFADGTPFAFSTADGDSIGSMTLVLAELLPLANTSIDLPGPAPPLGLRGGQSLNVFSGGQLPASFNAGAGSSVRIYSGAVIGSNFEVVDGTVEIWGGAIGADFDAFKDSTVDIYGGIIGASFAAHNGSTVNIHGGSLGPGFQAFAGSTVNFRGNEFLVNGAPIDGLAIGQELLLATRSGTLSGRLADGSTLTVSLDAATRSGRLLISPDARLTLTLVPEPMSGLTCLFGILVCGARRCWHTRPCDRRKSNCRQ